jgi:hypothetical protein
MTIWFYISALLLISIIYRAYFTEHKIYERRLRRDLRRCMKNKSLTIGDWLKHLENIDELLITTKIKKHVE